MVVFERFMDLLTWVLYYEANFNCLFTWKLQIHYDRVGKDGLFSHKEVTVLFVPDLSECLPSLDAWRAQWLAHKKAIAEREHQLSWRKEVCWFQLLELYSVNIF